MSGFRVSGFGFSGFGVGVSGFRIRISGLGSRISGFALRVWHLWSRVSSLEFRFSGSPDHRLPGRSTGTGSNFGGSIVVLNFRSDLGSGLSVIGCCLADPVMICSCTVLSQPNNR